MYICASCGKKSCLSQDLENLPGQCPTGEFELIEEIKEAYKDELNMKIAHNAAITEAHGYGQETRIEETINFFKRMGVEHVGLAFCNGLFNEAKTLTKILNYHGFKVESAMCKSGGIEKEFIGIEEDDKLKPGELEVMCNPIGQAIFMNKAGTEYNIILGLCVGHDSLFLKYSQAPVTVIGVKDRVTCHNPIAPLYLADKYYKKKFFPGSDEEDK